MTAESTRPLALRALQAIEEGAFANLALPKLLADSELERRDRDFVTGLVYGVTRMRRALDWIIDQRVDRPLEPVVRNALRLGLFQLHWLDVPAHAAVSTVVDATPHRARGLVNAVLRRARPPDRWPDLATELSYPDWIVERLEADLGTTEAHGALRTMNDPPPVSVRPDGYTQDLASQWVSAAAGAWTPQGGRVVDLCAAPGGKATGLASKAGLVAAADLQPHRVRLIEANRVRLGLDNLVALVSDARYPPFAPGRADVVLVDAPCSGLGALRRRPDARWRIRESAVGDLAGLQRRLLQAAAEVVAPGGVLAYSACTMTADETTGVDAFAATELAGWSPLAPSAGEWRRWGRGFLVLPQDHQTDAMFLLILRRPSS